MTGMTNEHSKLEDAEQQIDHDLYFPPEDSEFEVACMPNARLIPVPSVWGHFAGGPGTNPVDVAFIDAKLKELLAS